MRRYLKRFCMVLLLCIIAVVVWRPLLKWRHLFNSSPTIAFAVPVFTPLALVDTEKMPLSSLSAIQLPSLVPLPLQSLQQAGFPVFDDHRRLRVGPYLMRSEAIAEGQRISQLLKAPITLVPFDAP